MNDPRKPPARRGRTPVVVTVAVVVLAAFAAEAGAFGTHKEITADALRRFLRPGVLYDINRQHDFVDASSRNGDDEKHFDDCEFDGAADYINDQYREARQGLVANRPFDATQGFGRALHPSQDFYSHSNWVEIGFPISDDPGTFEVEGGAVASDLVDLSGAQSSLALRWHAPGGGATVREHAQLRSRFGQWNILLGADDWGRLPPGWDIDPTGRPSDPGGVVPRVPTLIDPQKVTRGKLLVSGEGTRDDECDVDDANGDRTYNGLEHDGGKRGLNKDGPGGPRDHLYPPARALATLQTSYEWCRMMHVAAQAQPAKDGMLAALWIRPGGNPHPAQTPCAGAPPGPVSVTVTILDVVVLDREEGRDDKKGEIQLGVSLYDSPTDFRRSVHMTNRSGVSMKLRDGDHVPAGELPPPLRLCMGAGQGGTLAVHAWDNDGGGRFANEYDNVGDLFGGSDDLLVGFQRRLPTFTFPAAATVESSHLRVRYLLNRSADEVVSPACGGGEPGVGP